MIPVIKADKRILKLNKKAKAKPKIAEWAIPSLKKDILLIKTKTPKRAKTTLNHKLIIKDFNKNEYSIMFI
jgi:hypothetical protein